MANCQCQLHGMEPRFGYDLFNQQIKYSNCVLSINAGLLVRGTKVIIAILPSLEGMDDYIAKIHEDIHSNQN